MSIFPPAYRIFAVSAPYESQLLHQAPFWQLPVPLHARHGASQSSPPCHNHSQLLLPSPHCPIAATDKFLPYTINQKLRGQRKIRSSCSISISPLSNRPNTDGRSDCNLSTEVGCHLSWLPSSSSKSGLQSSIACSVICCCCCCCELCSKLLDRYSYGRYSNGLYSYGRYSYGLYSCGGKLCCKLLDRCLVAVTANLYASLNHTCLTATQAPLADCLCRSPE